MKYTNTLELLKIFARAVLAPESISNTLKKSDISNYSNDLNLNKSMNNSIYAEPKYNNIEFNKNVPNINDKSNKGGSSYTNYEYNDYSKRQKDMSPAPQGVIDSITQELTSVRLQQAIILSEIVGKPKSKTRKRRRF